MTMTADPLGQVDPEDTSVDSAAGVWVGVTDEQLSYGNLIQTGYAYDASDPTGSQCAGFSDSCDYGLFWEAINADYECTVNGESTQVCPPYPYSGDPTIHVGDVINELVEQLSNFPGTYNSLIEDVTTGQVWDVGLTTGSYSPNYAEFIVEAPTNPSGSVPVIEQIADFSSESVDFEDAEVCTEVGCITAPAALSSGYYNSLTMNQGEGANTQPFETTSSDTFLSGTQTYIGVKWLTSAYNYCTVNDNEPPRCQSTVGGCVDVGTSILTPVGYVPIQNLRTGDSVVEYNLSSQSVTSGTLLWDNTSEVSELISVDHGRLVVTPTDQPIYIENSSYNGWLRDPQNLSVGDSIFDPVSMSWIPVDSVTTLMERSTVYDVVTSGWNNFVANGALLDLK